MKQALAVAKLTFREGIRMRIVLVFLIVLGFVMLRLPFALKGDETLAGRLQTFLSYSLTALSFFMSLATVFLSSATLSQEFRTRTLHLVVTKPVTRFQILVGKWLGVNALALLICTLSGLAIYGFACFIKDRPALFPRDRTKIEQVVWTARLAASPTPPDFRSAAERVVDERQKEQQTEFVRGREAEVKSVERALREAWRQIPPGDSRVYKFEGLAPPVGMEARYQVRFKIRALPMAEFVQVVWGIVDSETGALLDSMTTKERPAEVHQFLVRAKGWVHDGQATLAVMNPAQGQYAPTIYFEGSDSLQILYRVGSFEWNYVKALLLILFRLSFLAALGVFFSTFVSFPVACFCVLSVLLFCMGTPYWLEAIGANLGQTGVIAPGTDPYGAWGPFIRAILVPLLKVVFPNFVAYDGVGELIEGYVVDGGLLLRAGLHTIVYGAVLLLIPGLLIFRMREVAETVY